MSALPTFDLLGLGCVAVDELLDVAEYPPADGKARVLRRRRQAGGQTLLALAAAARQGLRCAYAGTLGYDADSALVLQTLEGLAIDVRLVCREESARPIRSTIVVCAQSGTRTIFYNLEGAHGAPAERPAAEQLAACRGLLIDQFGMEGQLRAVRMACARGIAVFADFESDERPEFPELLSLVDHVVLGRMFAARLTGESQPAAAARGLCQPGRQSAVVTGGAAGCWLAVPQGNGAADLHHQAAPQIAAIDTTGCGDVFRGAYAAAILRGQPPRVAVQHASAAAALYAARGAGVPGMPTWEETTAFLAQGAD